jgi:hypothetical protein
MKNLVLIFTALLATTALLAQPKVSLGEPDLTVDKDVHDFGVIEQNADGTCIFTITNMGSEPLIISKCDKTCGCTVPQCNHDPILSQETSEIRVSYDTGRIGPFNKSVKVHTNDPDEPLKILRVTGEVIVP